MLMVNESSNITWAVKIQNIGSPIQIASFDSKIYWTSSSTTSTIIGAFDIEGTHVFRSQIQSDFTNSLS